MMLVIYGPTTTGKTNLAIILAKKYSGEIISVDSRQVYRRLDIGTGKVSPQSKIEKHQNYWVVNKVKIWGFDLVDPEEKFTVVDFIEFANQKIQVLQKEKKLPILVGGTGFYIKSILDGIQTADIKADPQLRSKLEKLTVTELFNMLANLDPRKAILLNRSDKFNSRRLIRAIEVAVSGKDATGPKTPAILQDNLMIGLTAPNKYLFDRADVWIKTRLIMGMVQEVKNLLQDGVDPKWLKQLGLEYRWLTRYLKGEIDYDSAISRLQGNIHDFIRRQKTWFKQFPQIKLYDISKKNYQHQIALLLKADIYSRK